MNNKIKVALLNIHWGSERMGGVEQSAEELLELLGDEIDYTVVSGYYATQPTMKQNAVFFKYKFGDNPLKFPDLYFNMRRILKDINMDIIHSKCISAPYKHPYFLEIHQPFFSKNDNMVVNNPIYRWIRNDRLKNADIILAHSNFVKDFLVNDLGIQQDKINVIPYGKNRATFQPSQTRRDNLRKELNIEDKFVFYYPARFHPLKNQDLAVKAYNLLSNRIKKDIFFIFSGGVDDKKYYNNLILSTGQNAKSFFITSNSKKLLDYYDASDCVISTSRHLETFGQILIEAMAMAKPLLLSDSLIFREIAKDAALYFDPFSEKEFADKLTAVMISKQTRQNLVERGEHIFSQNYDLSLYKRRMFGLYNAMMHR